jgi:general secretion pathway protein A
MYTAHYNLKKKPFQISSDAAFIWLGEKHEEALATLRYGILDNKGFLVLTGDVGTGKTTLINALISGLSNDVIYASVPDPSLEKMDFFNFIAAAFGIDAEFASKGKFLSGFSRFLHRIHESGKKVLLIIDESQLLTQELLEEVRLLSNIVTQDSSPLLNIFFVGQYEFNELIRRPENRAIAQRLTLNYYIEPLTMAETENYIRHRLQVAGTTARLFDEEAIREIHAFSNGFPRRINIICDHCLMSGYTEDKTLITGPIARESAQELHIPASKREQPQALRPSRPSPAVPPIAPAQTPEKPPAVFSPPPEEDPPSMAVEPLPKMVRPTVDASEAGLSLSLPGRVLLIALVLFYCFLMFPFDIF